MNLVETERKRILLVEDDDTTRNALRGIIEKEGYGVTTAINGRVARDILAMEKFELVLSDIHMPQSPVTGIELLHVVKKSCATPVILMTGYASLVESSEASRLGADGFLAKPFKPGDLLKAIEAACGPAREASADDMDENYCKLNIDDFVTGKQIQYNIFIRLSGSKYVKVAHGGEELPVEQIRSYKSKGIRHLYLRKEDFHRYLQFSLNLSQAVRSSQVISNEKKLQVLKHTAEVILEDLYTTDIDKQRFNDACTIVQATVGFLAEAQETFDLIGALNAHSDSLYAHSLGVSLYASLMAREVGWTSANTIYKVSMAGILHDIGMKEIDREIYEKPRTSLSSEEVRKLETHASRGMEILSRTPCIPSDVVQIVMHHHERDSGNGYPAGLLKPRIHPLARLIAVADEFCDLAVKGPNYSGLSPRDAVTRLTAVYGSMLDPRFMEVLWTILKPGERSAAS